MVTMDFWSITDFLLKFLQATNNFISRKNPITHIVKPNLKALTLEVLDPFQVIRFLQGLASIVTPGRKTPN